MTTLKRPRLRRRRRSGPVAWLPLRSRVALTFGLLSVLITGTIAFATWRLSSNYMLDQRERSAVSQAVINAGLVERRLARDPDSLPDLLTGLGAQADSAVLLVRDGRWMSSDTMVDVKELPAPLMEMVSKGQAAEQRVRLRSRPALVVGIPLTAEPGGFVQVFPIGELDRNFGYLSWMLIAGVVVSGAVGCLLGYWAGRRALRPLRSLTEAAQAAAGGDLGVRMPTSKDRDLAPIASAFNATAERLQQRVARDARFAADVSHELRSPLTTMLNAMAVLRRRKHLLAGSALPALELLDTELVRFQRMVIDLLEISLSDAGAPAPDVESVELGELIREATRHHLERLELPAVPVHVMADRRRLERALANLVDNAEAHGAGLLRLALCAQDGVARIEVDDAGPGIPIEARERVFDRFTRVPASSVTSETSRSHGSGLGLALVSQHVRHHGGRVWIEDRAVGGTRFVVELPRSD